MSKQPYPKKDQPKKPIVVASAEKLKSSEYSVDKTTKKPGENPASTLKKRKS
jgi:hypothetical protein